MSFLRCIYTLVHARGSGGCVLFIKRSELCQEPGFIALAPIILRREKHQRRVYAHECKKGKKQKKCAAGYSWILMREGIHITGYWRKYTHIHNIEDACAAASRRLFSRFYFYITSLMASKRKIVGFDIANRGRRWNGDPNSFNESWLGCARASELLLRMCSVRL